MDLDGWDPPGLGAWGLRLKGFGFEFRKFRVLY